MATDIPWRWCSGSQCVNRLRSDNRTGLCMACQRRTASKLCCPICNRPQTHRSPCPSCQVVLANIALAHSGEMHRQPAGQEERIAAYAKLAATQQPLFGGRR